MASFSSLINLVSSLLNKTSTQVGTNGNDIILGTFGTDWLYGGAGKDKIYGGFGRDWIYGDGAPELQRTGVDFETSKAFSTLSADKQSMTAAGLKVEAIGGDLAQFAGLSIQAPLDFPTSGEWTKEIDRYNSNNVDNPEGVRMKFDVAQADVTITLAKFYVEPLFGAPEAEKAVAKVFFTDGTSQTITVEAIQTGGNGEADVRLTSTQFGGKLIAAVELRPDSALPANVPASQANEYNATHPFSDFTVKSVSYVADKNTASCDNDKLYGGLGSDKIYGGRGNDYLSGSWGNDLLIGGSGNNTLCGGAGKDTFGFGWDSTGKDVVKDFCVGTDKLKLFDGITVTGMSSACGDTVLTLSSGGTVTLVGVNKLADWHSLI